MIGFHADEIRLETARTAELFLGLFLGDCACDLPAYGLNGASANLIGRMSITLRGRGVAVPEKNANHRQAHLLTDASRTERMSQIVGSDAAHTRTFEDGCPRPLQVRARLFVFGAG
jgi:hypothetical protein